jgi:hypothetical protein
MCSIDAADARPIFAANGSKNKTAIAAHDRIVRPNVWNMDATIYTERTVCKRLDLIPPGGIW